MTFNGWLQIALFCVVIALLVKPLGGYMTRVFTGERTFLSPALGPVERLFYRLSGVDERSDQNWLTYAVSMLLFSLVGFASIYALMRLQAMLPFNPAGQSTVEEGLAFNTALSFNTNTNWQSYVPETTMSYLVQMAGLTVHNFVSAATGIALAIALVRGFARRSAQGIGNFWVDLTRCTLYVLLPISLILAVIFMGQGVIQNFDTYKDVSTVESLTYSQPKLDAGGLPLKDAKGNAVTETLTTHTQSLPMGPVASQEAIKMLGTNGGGFFNANSAHPFENPTPLTNFLQMISMLLIP